MPASLLIDRRLAEVAHSFDFLRLVTPVDTEEAWRSFRAAGATRTPLFHYRPLPLEPEEIRRTLSELPLDEVADPILSNLFQAKQEELERKVTMLEHLGTRRFFYGSLQL